MKIFFLLLLSLPLAAQLRIDVNLDMVHTTGEVDSFEREKHIVIHENLFSNDWDSDEQRASFLNEYNVYLGRDNGHFGWQYNQSFEDPNKPGYPDLSNLATKGQRERDRYANSPAAQALEHRTKSMMIGGQMFNFPVAGPTNPNPCCGPDQAWTYANADAVGVAMANFLKEFFGEGGATGQVRPSMVEVINEPFVKDQQYNVTRQEMTEWHNEVAARIRELTPEVLVGGYSAAFPAFEGGNFGVWNNSWKLFIDGAGANMDFYSIHLYDFGSPEDPLDIAYRSGSNVEAILDMVEAYSMIKDGTVKPWNISEYGYWSPGWNNTRYTKQRDWHFIRGMSTMLTQFLERPDVMLKTVPFLLTKASWADGGVFNRYPHRLLRQKKELEGETGEEWVYTEQLKFYQLWSDVAGKRLDTYSPDPDIMVDAYGEGTTAYLILNNMEFEDRDLQLNLLDQHFAGLDGIRIKHLYEGADGIPVLEESTVTPEEFGGNFNLRKQASAVLELTFRRPLTLSHSSREKKYYADKMLQPIRAGQAQSFSFSDVTTGPEGEATLRVGIGREKPRSRRPTVRVNGTEIDVPEDYRGNDQRNRDDFFGVLEIPVAMADLRFGDNTVEVSFPDAGGHVSSVTMQVWNFSRPVTRGAPTTSTDEPQLAEDYFDVFPNPATDRVRVRTQTAGVEISVSLVAADGRTVRSPIQGLDAVDVDVRGLPAGVYSVVLRSADGVGVTRVVKR